ncbi:Zinc finger CCHC domain-containing protein 24 [Aphelenchoides besseyi]|nr:Zinc finger CCHC domain-containing protein 24 [Aphelenchoides besseyi]
MFEYDRLGLALEVVEEKPKKAPRCLSDSFDCGASSGYGSSFGTPLHSPSSAIFVQRLLSDENERELTTLTDVSSTDRELPQTPQTDGFTADEIAQFAQLLCSPKKLPPARYQCHICWGTGHYINDCPSRFHSNYEELTPYQGRKKCFGEFACHQCKRRWTSQNSVANEAQNCIKCSLPIFPHKQLPVEKAAGLGLVKALRTVPSKVTPIGHGRRQ